MGIELIRSRLRGAKGFGKALEASLDAIGFDEEYVQRFASLSQGGRPKYVKDSIWGMMTFEPDELAIIDTPILQRLRRIAQLGLTFLTYPSAEHSRFAHTLGVSHVVKKLIASIDEMADRERFIKAGREEYRLHKFGPKDPIAQRLVHAALLHDIGHLAFSHAGEGAFMSASETLVGGMELEDFIALFREQGFESSLSECLSIAICLSERFERFYAKVVGNQQVARSLNDICCFIGGVPHDRLYPGLANLISGAAVDADKIDYLNRDARQCGIPVGVDVARVFLNSALVVITEQQAQDLSRSKVDRPEKRRFDAGTHFIVNSSGIDTYDELASAKSVLYQRVYLHHLTRNAEQVLAEALRKAMAAPTRSEGGPPRDLKEVFDWFQFGDDEFLAILSRNAGSKRAALRLVTRALPKRAFVVFRDACEPFIALDDIFDAADWGGRDGPLALAEMNIAYHRQTAWRLFDRLVPFDPIDRQLRLAELRDDIRKAAVDLRTILQNFDPRSLTGDEPYIGISPRYKLTPINEVLVREKTSIGHSGHWTKSEELANAQHIGRGVDHIHADEDWRLHVAVACMKVLYELDAGDANQEIDIGAPRDHSDVAATTTELRSRLLVKAPDVCARTGLDHDELVSCMQEAAQAGYFAGAERVVPLTGDQLFGCREIARQYQSLKGEGGWRVSEASASAFVRQFPIGLRSPMIELLKSGTIIGRGVVRESVDRLMPRLSSGPAEPLIFARFSPNSGSQIGIMLEQERKKDYEKQGHRFARSHSELFSMLETESASGIVFLDDQFASGSQAHAQLLHWAGKPREEWPVEMRSERNIELTEIDARARRHLTTRKVRLAFLYGTEKGRTRIGDAARDLGFTDLEAVFDEVIPSTPATIPAALKDHLAKVGHELMRRVRYGDKATLTEDEEGFLDRNALGYGNLGSVMTTLSGAPSHAITALWCPGIYEGQAWLPLLLRRGYRRFLVLG